jgi:hypothetical protein
MVATKRKENQPLCTVDDWYEVPQEFINQLKSGTLPLEGKG